MKFLYLVLVAVSMAACTSRGTRNPSAELSKPRHVLITLHGVRGNLESFGDFHKIITGNLEKIDPNYKVEVYNWTYPVGNAVEDRVKNVVWGPHEIANKLNQDYFLGSNPKIAPLGPQDKISFVAYSMGGLMIMSWYYDTMYNFRGHPGLQYSAADHQQLLGYLSKVENVIGLGSVFWGSLDAELGWSVLERGALKEIQRNIPKLNNLCESPEVKAMNTKTNLVMGIFDSVLDKFNGYTPTELEKNNAFLENSMKVACDSASFATNIATNPFFSGGTYLNNFILSQTKSLMNKLGNVSPWELNNMRITSDAINEMRLNRISHLVDPVLKERYKARWTSIVGVFPCLGKTDKGLTCQNFKSEDFKKINDSFVTLFSGLKRRETDGPVASPNAVADFIFYYEGAGKEGEDVPFEKFYNTNDIQKASHVTNQEIFVENMHATVVPALEAMTGILKSIGQSGAEAMKKFDASLGTDVVIVNKECVNPVTCNHPNYKHILQTLSKCDANNTATGFYCDQNLMNQFFHVNDATSRLAENDALRKELGSYILTLNIRLPKDYVLDAGAKNDIMSALKFPSMSQGPGVWGENRLDNQYLPYALQIARPSEFISSYSYLKAFADSKVLSVFLVGRIWAKNGQESLAQESLQSGVPVQFQINLPGVRSRRVVAKVKPTYTTYVDLYMK